MQAAVRGRASRGAQRVLGALVSAGVVAAACSRQAEIADEPDGGIQTPPGIPTDDAGLTPVDAGFETDAFVACAERPSSGDCRGANDFPCAFASWVRAVVNECQTRSGCLTNGRVSVDMGADGCVSEIAMSEPNAAFVSCARESFGAVSCPCGEGHSEEYLGSGNRGCPDAGAEPCSSREFPCPAGRVCVGGFCLPAN